MKLNTVERWEYTEYTEYEVESLPEHWATMTTHERHLWVVDNGEFYSMESQPTGFIEVLEVEQADA